MNFIPEKPGPKLEDLDSAGGYFAEKSLGDFEKPKEEKMDWPEKPEDIEKLAPDAYRHFIHLAWKGVGKAAFESSQPIQQDDMRKEGESRLSREERTELMARRNALYVLQGALQWVHYGGLSLKEVEERVGVSFNPEKLIEMANRGKAREEEKEAE